MMSLMAAANTSASLETFKPVIDALQGQISVSNVVTVVAGIVGLGIAGVFMWWGLRKGWRFIMSTTLKGRGKI